MLNISRTRTKFPWLLFTEGYGPKFWMDTNVTPINMKGSRNLTVSYRNVSLTLLVCKILEDLIRDKLPEFLKNDGLIAKEQNGFVKRKSCVTYLLETPDLITKSLSDLKIWFRIGD